MRIDTAGLKIDTQNKNKTIDPMATKQLSWRIPNQRLYVIDNALTLFELIINYTLFDSGYN